eukprot:767789-Hanusia_phi.AAC.2
MVAPSRFTSATREDLEHRVQPPGHPGGRLLVEHEAHPVCAALTRCLQASVPLEASPNFLLLQSHHLPQASCPDLVLHDRGRDLLPGAILPASFKLPEGVVPPCRSASCAVASAGVGCHVQSGEAQVAEPEVMPCGVREVEMLQVDRRAAEALHSDGSCRQLLEQLDVELGRTRLPGGVVPDPHPGDGTAAIENACHEVSFHRLP